MGLNIHGRLSSGAPYHCGLERDDSSGLDPKKGKTKKDLGVRTSCDERGFGQGFRGACPTYRER